VTASRIYSGWIPYDEGVMAQSAERVMLGELPHRDFVELWTGGLSLVHGMAFELLGPSLRLMRTILLLAFLATLPAVYFSARRFLSDWGAAGLTVVAGAWSVLSWPLPLPSWYVLFAELWTVLAVLAWMDSRRRRWLLIAGIAAGVALTIKIVGLYIVAAVLLGIAFDAQRRAASRDDASTVSSSYRLAVTAAATLLVVIVLRLVSPIAGPTPWFHYVMPVGALCGALVWSEWRTRHATSPWPGAIAPMGTFLAGVAIPVAAFVAYYAAHGALADLIRGVFVTPRMRFDVVAYPLPGLKTSFATALPILVLAVGGAYLQRPLRRAHQVTLFVAVALAIALIRDGSALIDFVWVGLRTAAPLVAVVAAVILSRRSQGERGAQAYFLAAATAMCSLIQVPFAYYPYFLYFAPIVFLAVAALNDGPRRLPNELFAAAALLLTAYAIRNPTAAGEDAPPPTMASLVPGRGGIRVAPADSATYGRLAELVNTHAGEWIYAWHNVPEVYFLTGRRNPTRTMFEVFDDSASRATQHLQRLLREKDVRAVVLTAAEGAPYPMPADLRAWIDSTYPAEAQAGRFRVRWRESPPGVPRDTR
jgi:hypothetical protein